MKKQATFLWLIISHLLLCASVLNAQQTDHVDSSQTPVLTDSSKKFWIPDVRNKNWTRTSNKLFSFQWGLVPILDYNLHIQDENSKQQVSNPAGLISITEVSWGVSITATPSASIGGLHNIGN